MKTKMTASKVVVNGDRAAFELRVGTAADIDTLCEIDSDASELFVRAGLDVELPNQHEFTLAERTRWLCSLSSGSTLLAVDASGGLLGFAASGARDGEPYLDQLSVRRHAMRLGVGTALLTETESRARTVGARTLWLTTYRHLSWNRPFYERRGFIVVPEAELGREMRAELVDFLYASLRYYKRIQHKDLRIVLLHSGDRLLPELSASLGKFTERKMRGRGIEVHLNARAVRVTDRDIMLDSGDSIAGGTVVCTIGTQPNPLLDQIPAIKNRGRLVVNPDFSVPGVEGVRAAGDCAAVVNAVDGKTAPPTAQFAEAEAKVLAENVVAKLAGRPTREFRYRPKGQLSSIGHNKAVAEIFGIKLSGFIAWLMWRGLYLLRIPTFARKSRLFLEWNWAMFFPPDIAHLGYRRTQRRAAHAVGAREAG